MKSKGLKKEEFKAQNDDNNKNNLALFEENDESEEDDPGLSDAHEELMITQYWGSRGVNY